MTKRRDLAAALAGMALSSSVGWSAAMASTPPRSGGIGAVGLRVRDLAKVSTFYQRILGLGELRRDPDRTVLGVGGRELLVLEESTGASDDDQRHPGLYHTAFLLPTFGDLARWLAHLSGSGVRLRGAANHLVSSACYLDDPEGNGIEVYADHPRENWIWDEGMVRMATLPLDMRPLLERYRAEGRTWVMAPPGTCVGHVHLRVGALPSAEDFNTRKLGMEVVRKREGAGFFSYGGYHHHLAANTWHSAGARPRTEEMLGLSWISLEIPDQQELSALHTSAGGAAVTDPWGIEFRLKGA